MPVPNYLNLYWNDYGCAGSNIHRVYRWKGGMTSNDLRQQARLPAFQRVQSSITAHTPHATGLLASDLHWTLFMPRVAVTSHLTPPLYIHTYTAHSGRRGKRPTLHGRLILPAARDAPRFFATDSPVRAQAFLPPSSLVA